MAVAVGYDHFNTSATTQQIQSLLASVTTDGEKFLKGDDSIRQELIEQAQALVDAIRSPFESWTRALLAEPTRLLATRVAIELKLFDTLVAEKGRPKSIEELAKPTNAAPMLVKRMIRHLASMNMVDQTDSAHYAPNRVTELMTNPKYTAGSILLNDGSTEAMSVLHKFLRENKYQNPDNSQKTAFHYAHGGQGFFQWLQGHPEVSEAFNFYMSGQGDRQPSWTSEGLYPVKERLIDGMKTEGDASALVDLGGGLGHVLKTFLAENPDWKGRVVVQDEAHVVEAAKKAKLDDRIEAMPVDFFQGQPLKGARAYYLRWIIHDWSDDLARTILGHLREAMTPGYSKIIINEFILADVGASWKDTSMDVYMMSLLGASERSEQEWRQLIESAGLKITGMWHKGPGTIGVIEISREE